MTPEQFNSLSLSTLYQLTGATPAMWSRYFNDRSTISEQTLNRCAMSLGVSSSELLSLVNARRHLKKTKKNNKKDLSK